MISYLISPSISTGGGGGWVWLGIVFGTDGSNWETWKTGWIAYKCSESRRVKKCVPEHVIMLKGPKDFSESFLEGLVVRMCSALM